MQGDDIKIPGSLGRFKLLKKDFLHEDFKKPIVIKILSRACVFYLRIFSSTRQQQNNEPQLLLFGVDLHLVAIDYRFIDGHWPQEIASRTQYFGKYIYKQKAKSFAKMDLATLKAQDKLIIHSMGNVPYEEYNHQEWLKSKGKKVSDAVESRAETIAAREKSNDSAIKDKLEGYNFYVYKNDLYCVDSECYSEDEQKLLIKEHYFKREKRFKSLQKEMHLFEKLESMQGKISREPIPEEVRFAVWRRDGGKCAKCGSKENLEFDHVIPLSKGGSNTVRNIQLLCEKCNREKSNKI